MAIKTTSQRKDERLVQAEGHTGRVFRLVRASSGEKIGDVVKIEYGPLIVGSPLECLTADDGQTFAHVSTFSDFDMLDVTKVVGSAENDPEKVAALRLLLNEWKRQLELAA